MTGKLLSHSASSFPQDDYYRPKADRRSLVVNHRSVERLEPKSDVSDIVGSSEEMQKVYRMMSLVAGCNSTVLLLGETGTGKELIARGIHNSSLRRNKPMIKVNCAALPASLIESELFGHERGAFTGAVDRKPGKFEMAHNSTLFLDEIGEMPMEMQVKLLRAIQEREFERVGGKTTIKVDVRIIAATNRDLEQEVDAHRFRADLYYRLNVFPITLPPLRERRDDIEPLAKFFLARCSKNIGKNVNGLSAEALHTLKHYPWPGNVRELENLMERSVLLTEGTVVKDLPLADSRKRAENDCPVVITKTLHDLERAYIIEILRRCGGRISGSRGAAAVLQIPSTTLHSKMKKLDISKSDYC